MTGRLLVMSDIHGMYHELMTLLKSIAFDPQADTLVVLGDYIDRGNYSRSVIEFFMRLKSAYPSRVTLLKGNHEDLCLQAQQGDEVACATATLMWMANGGNTTLNSFSGTIPPDVVSFLEDMPSYAETEQYIFVHAGVHPSLPLKEMNPQHILWSSSHLPHCSGKMVIVGHVIRDEVTYSPKGNTLYIDTGAFRAISGASGKLSLVDLTNKKVHWVNAGGLSPGTYEVKDLYLAG